MIEVMQVVWCRHCHRKFRGTDPWKVLERHEADHRFERVLRVAVDGAR